MQYSILGKTGLEVSKLCFGTLPMGPLQSNLPVEQAAEILLAAFNLGVNFIDTAQLYQTYPHIKLALKQFYGNVIIASKTYAHTAELAVKAVEEARRELDRDYIDIFLLHEQESEHTLRGHAFALEQLETYKARGIIKAVGLSTHHVQGVYAAAQAGLDIVHPLVNIAGLGIQGGTRQDMEQAIIFAKSSGLGVYTMKALGGGNLFARAGEALSYALSVGDSLAVGMKHSREVTANVGFIEKNGFDDSDINYLLSREKKIFIEKYCTGCGKCVAACKSQALVLQGSQVLCKHERCLLCGYCSASCENFFIKIV